MINKGKPIIAKTKYKIKAIINRKLEKPSNPYRPYIKRFNQFIRVPPLYKVFTKYNLIIFNVK